MDTVALLALVTRGATLPIRTSLNLALTSSLFVLCVNDDDDYNIKKAPPWCGIRNLGDRRTLTDTDTLTPTLTHWQTLGYCMSVTLKER